MAPDQSPAVDDPRVAAVTHRLLERTDGIPREVVEQHVREGFARWEDARVRDFVPIFVERAARARLAQLSHR